VIAQSSEVSDVEAPSVTTQPAECGVQANGPRCVLAVSVRESDDLRRSHNVGLAEFEVGVAHVARK